MYNVHCTYISMYSMYIYITWVKYVGIEYMYVILYVVLYIYGASCTPAQAIHSAESILQPGCPQCLQKVGYGCFAACKISAKNGLRFLKICKNQLGSGWEYRVSAVETYGSSSRGENIFLIIPSNL